MERQFVVTVLAAVAAWYLIERLKELRGDKPADPLAGLAAAEGNSEIMV